MGIKEMLLSGVEGKRPETPSRATASLTGLQIFSPELTKLLLSPHRMLQLIRATMLVLLRIILRVTRRMLLR